MKLLESACTDFARSRLNKPKAAMSRGPKLIRGPVKWRIKEEPASGSVMIFIKVTTSATSGIWISPPIPITSTGNPCWRRAISIAGIWLRFLTRTAHDFKAAGSHRFLKYSPTAAASLSIVSYTP